MTDRPSLPSLSSLSDVQSGLQVTRLYSLRLDASSHNYIREAIVFQGCGAHWRSRSGTECEVRGRSSDGTSSKEAGRKGDRTRRVWKRSGQSQKPKPLVTVFRRETRKGREVEEIKSTRTKTPPCHFGSRAESGHRQQDPVIFGQARGPFS